MDKKRTTKEKKIRYFHEEQAKEEELLNIGLKESRRAKKERLEVINFDEIVEWYVLHQS